jgi:hypothetical protein
MTKDFTAEDVKAGDLLIAHNGDGTLAHKWIVTENYRDEIRGLGFINVYVMFAQSYLEETYSFYYDTFERYREMAEWSLERVS